MPQKCNLANKISLFMQSEAFAQSQKILPTCSFCSVGFNVLSVSLKDVLSVDIPVLKPYCSVTDVLLVYSWWHNLL